MVRWTKFNVTAQENLPAGGGGGGGEVIEARAGPPPNFWFVQDLGRSGLVDYQHLEGQTHTHYIRPSTRSVIDYLNATLNAFETRHNNLYLPSARVFGGSGVGKSTETWAWFHLQTVERLWIHNHTEGTEYHIVRVRLTDNGSSRWDFSVFHGNDILQQILEFINALPEGGICVLDGTFKSDAIEMFFGAFFLKKIYSVVCTSGQSSGMIVARRAQFLINKLIVDGFTKEEFIAAEALYHPGKTAEEISEVYFYSGGSARYYFGYSDRIPELCEVLREKIRFLRNSAIFFAGEDNPLTTYRHGTCVLVSKFIAKVFSAFVSSEFITAAKLQLPDDNSWQGWVAELDFHMRVRAQKSHNLHLVLKDEHQNTVFDKAVAIVQRFNDLNEILSAAVFNADGVLYVPENYYNPGYDAIHVSYGDADDQNRRPVTVNVFQITVAEGHTKKLMSTFHLLQRLFPLTDFQEQTRFPLASVHVEYRIVTKRENIARFNMALKSTNLTGIPQIQQYDPNFAYPASFSKVYYDAEIPF